MGRWVALVAVAVAACSSGVALPDEVACEPMAYVSSELGDADVWLVVAGEARAVTGQGLHELNPAFSPDGRRIAFIQGPSDADLALLSMALDGSDTRLEWDGDDLSVSSVDWGEQGFVVDAFGAAAPLQVFTILAGAEQATTEGVNGKPVWAGDRILHLHLDDDEANQDVGYTDPDGSFTNLTDSPDSRDVLAEPSPDGSTIAFVSDRAGTFDIWVMAPDGSDPLPLTADPAEESNPTWSSDGRHLLYTVDDGDGPEIWVMDADGSDPRRVGAGWVPDCP